jgi:hypothetical protein
VELYTAPPAGSTVICADELGPVIPRTFPPAPGVDQRGDCWIVAPPLQAAAAVAPPAVIPAAARMAAG